MNLRRTLLLGLLLLTTTGCSWVGEFVSQNWGSERDLSYSERQIRKNDRKRVYDDLRRDESWRQKDLEQSKRNAIVFD